MHVANRVPAPPIVSCRRVVTRALHGGPGSGGSDKRLILPGGPGQGAAQQSGDRGSRLIIPPGPGSRGPTANGDAPPPPMAPSETFGNFKPPPGFFRDPEAAIVGQAQEEGPEADAMLRRISSSSGAAVVSCMAAGLPSTYLCGRPCAACMGLGAAAQDACCLQNGQHVAA